MPPLNEDACVLPWDAHNQTLVDNVHPSDWVNPDPASRYNLVVIGAGTAGLVTAAGAAGLGAKVALVEGHLLGGDCLNVGCVPSKCLIRSARAAADARNSERFGVRHRGSIEVDFAAVMERMRRLRATISPLDSARRFRGLGVDVFLGKARFVASDEIEVCGKALCFKKAVIATGGRPAAPKIEGLKEAGYLTNETVFSLTERPRRLAVIGGGPIGCELAQAFQRLGSNVVLFHKHPHLLDREDADVAEIIHGTFLQEGMNVILNCQVQKITTDGSDKTIHFEENGQPAKIVVDEILVAAGRVPNVAGIGLECAGVEFDARVGVMTNDHLQTTNPRIYAAGDVCMSWKFTHAADAAARVVIQNSLFLGRKKISALTVPRCTYTDPEVAHVGLSEREARERNTLIDTFAIPMRAVDRAIVDGETDGFVKIHVRRGGDQILGSTIVARHAGEMINEVTLAMVTGNGLGTLANVIHPYPTQAEGIRKAANAWNRQRLTPTIKKLAAGWLAIAR